MKLAIAITGASGVGLAKRFIDNLPQNIEAHVVASANASIVSVCENKKAFFYNDSEISASIASGSFGVDASIILPCSMNTLAKIACGISDNLPTRVAAVALKERKTLLLAPREMPFSTIALENMHKLSMMGVIISPPVIAYYSEISTLEEMEMFLVGKWYDALGIPNNLYKRWSSNIDAN